MSISLKDVRYKILEKIWDQKASKTESYFKEKDDLLKDKISKDPDYLKDRNLYLKLEKEGYLSYLLDHNDHLNFIESDILIYKNNKFYLAQEVENYCMRRDNSFLFSKSYYRRYEEFFTEEEQVYIENLEARIEKINNVYDELCDRIRGCNSFAELASISEVSNFFDKSNSKKFNHKAKLKDIMVSV